MATSNTWSKELKEKVYGFTRSFARLKEGRAAAQGHLNGTRKVAAPHPADDLAPPTRNSVKNFLVHTQGCDTCNLSLLPLTPQQASRVNLPGEWYVCCHRAPVDRFELLLDSDHEARSQSLGIPNFTYSSELKKDCGNCEVCQAPPCGACKPCRKKLKTCKAKVCTNGIVLQPYYLPECDSSVGTSVMVEDMLSQDLKMLAALKKSFTDAALLLTDHLEIEDPDIEGSHPLLTLEALNQKSNDMITEVGELEEDLTNRMGVLERDATIDEELEGLTLNGASAEQEVLDISLEQQHNPNSTEDPTSLRFVLLGALGLSQNMSEVNFIPPNPKFQKLSNIQKSKNNHK